MEPEFLSLKKCLEIGNFIVKLVKFGNNKRQKKTRLKWLSEAKNNGRLFKLLIQILSWMI